MTPAQHIVLMKLNEVAKEARKAGFAVSIFTPDEVAAQYAGDLQALCATKGNEWLDAASGRRPLRRWRVTYFDKGADQKSANEQFFDCDAEGDLHAMEQCEDAYPAAVILSAELTANDA